MSGWALEVFLPLGRSYRHLMRVETLPSFALILRAQEDCLMGSSKESLHCSFTKSRASSSSIDVLRVTETGLWGFELTCFCISDHTGINFVV